MAANADVVFRLGADVDEAIAAIKRAQSALADLGDPAKTPAPVAPPKGAWAAFGSEVRGSLGGVSGELMRASQSGQAFSAVMGGIAGGAVAGAVTAGFAAIAGAARGSVQAVQESIVAAAESEQVFLRLEKALKASGSAADAGKLISFASSMATATLRTDEEIAAIEQLGVSMSVPVGQIPRFTAAVLDMSSALGVDATTAAKALAQSLDGDAKRLEELVPELQGTSEAAYRTGAAIEIVGAKFRGMAVSDADSLQGAISGLGEEFGELKEAFGAGLTASGELQRGLLNMTDTARGLRPVMETLGESISGAFSDSRFDKVSRFLPVLSGGRLLGDLLGAAQDSGEAANSADRALASRGGAELGGLRDRQDEAARSEMQARIQRDTDEMIARRKREADETRAAQQAFADKARAEAEAVRAQLAAIDGATFATMRQRSEIEGMALTIEREVGLYDELDRRITAAGSSLFALYQSGKIDADQYEAKLNSLIGAHEQLAEQTAAARLEAFSTAQASEIASGGGVTDVMAVDTGTGAALEAEARASQVAGLQELEALEAQHVERVVEMINLGMTRSEAEAALTEELLRQAAAQGDLAAKQELQIRSAERQQMAFNKSRAAMQVMGQAGSQLASGLVQMAITGEGSIKRLVGATMQGLATEAAGKAIMQTAEGFASSAMHDYKGAAEHFASAKFFGVVAAIAGGSAIAMGGGGGGGSEGGGGGESGGSSISGGTDNFSRDVAEGQRMPAVTVQFTGNGIIAGTTPEAFAGAITPFIQDVVAESGGRQGSVRP